MSHNLQLILKVTGKPQKCGPNVDRLSPVLMQIIHWHFRQSCSAGSTDSKEGPGSLSLSVLTILKHANWRMFHFINVHSIAFFLKIVECPRRMHLIFSYVRYCLGLLELRGGEREQAYYVTPRSSQPGKKFGCFEWKLINIKRLRKTPWWSGLDWSFLVEWEGF